jgi:hypothetical protein
MNNCCFRCGCYQCNCNYVVFPTTGSGGITGATNINQTGIGVYDSMSGTTLQFRGITSANGYLGVTLDGTNHSILLSLDINAFVAALPAATTTQAGVLETATNAEAIAKGATDKTITPSNLASLGSSETFAGFIEIATQAETNAGVVDAQAVTPLKLKTYLTTQQNIPKQWTDDVARAAVAADRAGQLGSQTDDGIAFVATGTGAGNWAQILALGDSAAPSLSSTNDVFIDMLSAYFSFSSTDSGGGVEFQSGCNIVTDATARWYLSNTIVPANNLVSTGVTAGQLVSTPISDFISSNNVQTGWAITNPATIRSYNTATITLQQLAQVVGTLVTDFIAKKLPSP